MKTKNTKQEAQELGNPHFTEHTQTPKEQAIATLIQMQMNYRNLESVNPERRETAKTFYAFGVLQFCCFCEKAFPFDAWSSAPSTPETLGDYIAQTRLVLCHRP